jgi:dihydrodipicolinate synthase/N-acetylneuraminate lyase
MATKQQAEETPGEAIQLTVEEVAAAMQFGAEIAQASATVAALQRGQAIFIEHLRVIKKAGADYELNNFMIGFTPKAKGGGDGQ